LRPRGHRFEVTPPHQRLDFPGIYLDPDDPPSAASPAPVEAHALGRRLGCCIGLRAPPFTASPRPYDGLPELQYPWHDREILVTACGRICMHRKKINVVGPCPLCGGDDRFAINSTVLAGQKLGIREVDDGIWLVSFMNYDLGYIDLEQRTLQTIDNPFGTTLSPMSQVRSVTHVSGPDTVRYTFTVRDSHPLLLAGLPAHSRLTLVRL